MQPRIYAGAWAVVLGVGGCGGTVVTPPGAGDAGGGAGGSLGECSTPVDSRPFSKSDWPAKNGTFQLAISAIAFDPSGKLGMTGYTESDVDMGGGVLRSGGEQDVLLATYDAAGNHTLSKLFGDDQNPQAGGSIAFDAQCNMFLVGEYSHTMDLDGAKFTSDVDNVFLAKLDGAGNTLWSEKLNKSDTLELDRPDADWGVESIAVDPTTGGVVIMGSYYGTLDFGGGPMSSSDESSYNFIAKFDAMGHFLWSRGIMADIRSFGSLTKIGHLAVGASGQVLVASSHAGTRDDTGGLKELFTIEPFTASGDSLEHTTWSTEFWWDESHQVYALTGLAVEGDGSVILIGNAGCDVDLGGGALGGANCSSYNAFVVKFDAQGAHRWSRFIDSSTSSRVVSLGLDSLGNAFVAGSVYGTLDADGTVLGVDGSERWFVVRFDGEGRISWSQTLGPDVSGVQGLAVDPEGNVAVLGRDASAADASFPQGYMGGNLVTKLNVAAP